MGGGLAKVTNWFKLDSLGSVGVNNCGSGEWWREGVGGESDGDSEWDL